MSLIPPGKYVAKANLIKVYETDKGALCAAIMVEVADGQYAGASFKSTQTMIKQDGTAQIKTIDTLHAVFGGDKTNPYWLEEVGLAETRFEIVVDIRVGEQTGKEYNNVQFINALGGGGGVTMPESANRTMLLNKFGAKFRALAGGAPIPPKPAAAPAGQSGPPTKPPVKKAPSKKDAEPVVTMDDAWGALVANNPKLSEEEQQKLWFTTMARVAPGKDHETVTSAEWQELKGIFSDNLPA